jgi:transcriptional regulator CtsR
MSDKQRYRQLPEQIRELEIERAELMSRGQFVPRRLNFVLAML